MKLLRVFISVTPDILYDTYTADSVEIETNKKSKNGTVTWIELECTISDTVQIIAILLKVTE